MTGVAKDTINDHVISRKLGMEKLPLRSFGTTDEYEVRFLTSYKINVINCKSSKPDAS